MYEEGNGPDNARPYRDPVPEALTSPRRLPAPSVRNGFNPPDVGVIAQKERQQLEYAEMLKQQMREREEAKSAAKQAKRIEEEQSVAVRSAFGPADHKLRSEAKQSMNTSNTTKMVTTNSSQYIIITS